MYELQILMVCEVWQCFKASMDVRLSDAHTGARVSLVDNINATFIAFHTLFQRMCRRYRRETIMKFQSDHYAT